MRNFFSLSAWGNRAERERENQRSAFRAMLLKTRAVALARAETAPSTSPVIAKAFLMREPPFRLNEIDAGALLK